MIDTNQSAGEFAGAFSEGFTFAPKPKIKINGREYVCDATDNDLLVGVAHGWPKILRITEQYMQLRDDVLAKRENINTAEQMIACNKRLLAACQEFIYGTLGREEYNEIFAGQRPNSADHLQLCTYIYSWIMQGRANYLEGYQAEEVDRDAAGDAAEHDHGAEGGDGLPLVDGPRGPRARFKAIFGRKG